jgi:hypothetical protein
VPVVVTTFGAPLGPLNPLPGEVYKVDTTILDDNEDDHADWRRAVIIDVPALLTGRITVVTRTSNTKHKPGILSSKNTSLDFNKPGIWGYLRTSLASLWTPETAKFSGVLPNAEIDKIRAVFL